ncbi:MAG: class I SAM-dependent methyltransferase [Desulfobacterales bacterium]|nr:class I SAM-dependent methyltransferase [Desulfobacterales bacterium]
MTIKKILSILFEFIINLFPEKIKYKLLQLILNSIYQTRFSVNKPNSSSYPFPLKLQLYETLYDKKTGGWHTPPAIVDISNFNKECYPSLCFDSVECEVGRFYYAFVSLVRPHYILETGVARGYSTSCIACALSELQNQGHVYAIDPGIYPHLWDNTYLSTYITWIPKKSQDALNEVSVRNYDILVIDSMHDYETCAWEVIQFEKFLKPGGYMLMHDSLYYDGVGAVVKQLSQNSRFEVVTLKTPRTHGIEHCRCPGLSVIYKIRDGEPELTFNSQYQDWFVGDALSTPFLHQY